MRARRRPQAVLLGALAIALPGLPHGWPKTLAIGLTESPGQHAPVHLAARYQSLANDWWSWNPNGTFASVYVQDSWAHGVLPVLGYDVVLQSGRQQGDEAATDLAHLRDPQLMARYWQNVRLLFQRIRGARPVVVHVEPDLWGYLEQATATALASGFAKQWIALRNRLAPNVLLAYHMSGWGTRHDIVYEDPPDATVRAYATQSAAFYNALHARFDLSLEDVSDRDAGFYEKQQGNAKTWFTPADFRRHLRMVVWQIPLGNTFLDDTWGRYRDNRMQWLLGAGNRAHLQAYVKAGYVGFLFGGGADGTTSAQTDGGYFYRRVESASPILLPR